MISKNILVACTILVIATLGCKKDELSDPVDTTIKVIRNDVPFPTDKYLRIGYLLKLWEFKKQGLVLQRIEIYDKNNRGELLTIYKEGMPQIIKDPIRPLAGITFDRINNYYMSVQLPIPLMNPVPETICHRFILKDTVNDTEVIVEGGTFSPRHDEPPVVINSPVKGNNWQFTHQPVFNSHFYDIMFLNGIIGSGERYASNVVRINDRDELLQGDSAVNESFFTYGESLFAVADGVVSSVRDGLPENNGNRKDAEPVNLAEYSGNNIIINLGKGKYALYSHCMTGSILVKAGDVVKEGDLLARIGNSGHSAMPHLHFEICDAPEFFMAAGQSFVLKKYTKTREFGNPPMTAPMTVYNSMMEKESIVNFAD